MPPNSGGGLRVDGGMKRYHPQVARPINPTSFAHRALLLIAVIAGSAVAQAMADAHAATRWLDRLTAEAVKEAELSSGRARHGPSAVILKAEILLDRAAISPGQIDGKDGDNLRKAISAFQGLHGLKRTGRLDEKTWSGLTQTSNDAVITKYEITEDDTKGPFVKGIPHGLVKMTQLHRLSCTSPACKRPPHCPDHDRACRRAVVAADD